MITHLNSVLLHCIYMCIQLALCIVVTPPESYSYLRQESCLSLRWHKTVDACARNYQNSCQDPSILGCTLASRLDHAVRLAFYMYIGLANSIVNVEWSITDLLSFRHCTDLKHSEWQPWLFVVLELEKRLLTCITECIICCN